MMIALTSVKDGIMNPVRNAVGYILVPIQTGVNRLGFGIYEELQEHRTLMEMKEENRKLSERIDDLTEENNRLKQEGEELIRLRTLYALDLDYMKYKKVAARVIAKDSENWFQVFRIDKGSQDGIRVDQNVMANGGLIGIVTDVGLNYATVRSIIDDESRVSAMGMHSSDTCIVAGDLTLYESGRLRITDLNKDAALQDGDRIVTSNLSSKFLPGILVGFAVDITDDEKHLMKNGYLIPAANFNDLSEVLVLRDVKADLFLKENEGQEILMQEKVPEPDETAPAETSNKNWAGMEGLTPVEEILINGNHGGAQAPDAAEITGQRQHQNGNATDAGVTTGNIVF